MNAAMLVNCALHPYMHEYNHLQDSWYSWMSSYMTTAYWHYTVDANHVNNSHAQFNVS